MSLLKGSNSNILLLGGVLALSVWGLCFILFQEQPGHDNAGEERWVAVATNFQLGNLLWELASAHGIAIARGARLCVLDADGHYAHYKPQIVWTSALPIEPRCPGWAVATPFFQHVAHFESIWRECAVFSADYVQAPFPRILLQNCLQSYKYFNNGVIPFRLKAEQVAQAWVRERNLTTAIHVRRGDKLTDSMNLVPPAHYYYKALEALHTLFPDEPKQRLVVVTDDEAWVRAHPLLGRKGVHILSTASDPAFDMGVISACKHKILSIGTFGWWGAYLADDGSNATHAVIYPLPQRVLGNDFRDTDFFPPHWTPLRYDL